jgi:hypothetical protein
MLPTNLRTVRINELTLLKEEAVLETLAVVQQVQKFFIITAYLFIPRLVAGIALLFHLC